jgi:glycosyltransferase involved in cell wall biosynthesis
LKICFFNSCKVWGGGEKWHLETAKQLKLRGNEVVISSFKNSELAQKALKSEIRVEEFKINNLTFFNIFTMFKLKQFFKREQFDLVILNLPSDLKSAGFMAKYNIKTKVIYRRGSAIPLKNSLFNNFLFSRIVDYIIVNSEETKKSILQNNEKIFKKEKIFTVYNGIDIEEYREREYKILYNREDSNEIVIGNAGRLSKQKNQIFLIKLAEYMKEKEIKFKILIAGKGELEEKLKEEVRVKKLEDKIIFLGFIENIKDFMKSIDIFLLPSYWEGFGYVMVEAMLCEKPVIAFNVSSNPEIVENGKSGFLIENDNIEDCYEKIKYIIEAKTNALKMGEYAKEYSEKKFSIKIAVENIEYILKKII